MEAIEQYFSGRNVRKAPLSLPSETSLYSLLSLARAFDSFYSFSPRVLFLA